MHCPTWGIAATEACAAVGEIPRPLWDKILGSTLRATARDGAQDSLFVPQGELKSQRVLVQISLARIMQKLFAPMNEVELWYAAAEERRETGPSIYLLGAFAGVGELWLGDVGLIESVQLFGESQWQYHRSENPSFSAANGKNYRLRILKDTGQYPCAYAWREHCQERDEFLLRRFVDNWGKQKSALKNPVEPAHEFLWPNLRRSSMIAR